MTKNFDDFPELTKDEAEAVVRPLVEESIVKNAGGSDPVEVALGSIYPLMMATLRKYHEWIQTP